MAECGYLMESEAVAIRLDVKTAGRDAEKQALWAGLNQSGNCGLIVGGCVGYPWRAKRPLGWHISR